MLAVDESSFCVVSGDSRSFVWNGDVENVKFSLVCRSLLFTRDD